MILLFFVAFMTVNIYTHWFREGENYYSKTPEEKRRFNSLWHTSSLIMWALVFFYVLHEEYHFGEMFFKSLSLFAALWWTVFDGGLNLLRGRRFFFQSKLTTSVMEKYAHPMLKMALITLGLAYYLGAFN